MTGGCGGTASHESARLSRVVTDGRAETVVDLIRSAGGLNARNVPARLYRDLIEYASSRLERSRTVASREVLPFADACPNAQGGSRL
jgi:hypothetical protein